MNRFSSVTSCIQKTKMDKSKDWQLELLMEKLRSKASQYKTYAETAKNVRMTMLDKRYALDSVEKSQHQKCLDTLQHSIKVTSLQSMIERLESLTRQLGLKFMVGPSGIELFISSDMFYLEIILDQTGAVRDVKVHHEGKVEQQSCTELVSCLSRQDFADFTAQLEGFTSIYQLNAEKKIKCKAFTALQSLESDLTTLAQLQTFMKEAFNLLHKSPVGVLEKRKGGHPMKLTYFVSPYDLIDTEKCDIEPMLVETVTSKNLGYSVTVCMEGSAAHKLQTTTLITVNRNHNGKNTPSFAPLTGQNSAAIPACFVLKLNKPMPICVALVKQIHQVTELECAELSTTHPLLSLIATHASEGKLDSLNNKGMFVTLPDQHHCYFLTENKNMEGILVSSIPFTHPGHVSQILVILRQQALFNTIISSCVRPNSKQDFENMIMFEISALSSTHISISMEHPMEESMATAEIDLTEISNLKCNIHTPGSPPPLNSPDIASELATKVLNRCFSIPVTMRAVIKLWEKQIIRKSHLSGLENFNLPLGSGDPGGRSGPPGGLGDFAGMDGKLKQEPSGNGNLGAGMNLPLISHQHPNMFLNESMMANNNFPNFQSPDSSVLSSMELTNILTGSMQQEKATKRQHKKKAGDELWKTVKKKPGDEELLGESSTSSDSTSRNTPISQETVSEIPTPTSALGFQSDLELSNLDPTELLGSSDKLSLASASASVLASPSVLASGSTSALALVSEFDHDDDDDLGDVEDILAAASRDHKPRKLAKSPTMDLTTEKSLVPPCVSITPIPTSTSAFTGNNSLNRPGIEIIPISTSATPPISNSITITPIASQSKSDDRSRDKKSSKSRSDDKSKLEKKRKRKREDSPMGPPDKVPTKQDPLTKPVSVSIKPAESPPLSVTPTSPSMMRKFTTSPTHGRSLTMSGKLSPNLLKPNLKQSPKHSPAHISSSPKHSISISSPKSHGTSPKHPSTSGSGKPSMSTLKNAANSPSGKSNPDSKNKSTSKDSRDKDKKNSSFGGNNSSKLKSNVKVKTLDLTTVDAQSVMQDNMPSPGETVDLSKSANANQARNRKSSLSQIVDKLKSFQHCDSVDIVPKSSNRERTVQTSSSSKSDSSKSANKIGENKNSEYMVKPSSDGIKLTINKTRKEGSKSGSIAKTSTGSGSPKMHTGLKPGVTSGPASKKPQQLGQKSNASNSTGTSTSTSTSTSSSSSSSTSYGSFKSSFNKSTSSGNLKSSTTSSSKSVAKLSSPKTSSSATDLSRNKDRPKLNKSNSEKSIFSSREGRKSSPTPGRDETDGDKAFKLSSVPKIDTYASQLKMEGYMKQLDKNFQIPKLSARSNEDKKLLSKPNNLPDALNNIPRTVESQMFDMMAKNDISALPKYPLPIPNKMFDGTIEAKIRNNMNASPASITTTNALGGNSPKMKSDPDFSVDSQEDKKREPQNLCTGKEDLNFKMNFPISATKAFPAPTSSSEPLSLSTKSVDLTSRFVAPAPKDEKKDKPSKSDSDNILIDYSSSKDTKTRGDTAISTAPQQMLPHSPSVSVHITPSPLINPSPHSASPCITDDELMDEALVGLGK